LPPKTGSKRFIDGLNAILEIRGYKVLEVEEEEDGISITAEMKTEGGNKEQVLAYVPDKEVVGVKIVRDINERVEKEGYTRAIVATRGKFTPYAKKESRDYPIDILTGAFPMFDIFSHDLVPLHELATPQEVEELKKRYGIELYQLPKVSQTDPVVRTLGARVGDVLKITREIETASNVYAFRVVVED
jgi:DNA-directed RNA polymerase subunit H